MPYLKPVPESAMRFYRPLGIGLLALLIALPLAIPMDVLFGPFTRDQMQYVIPAIAAVLFWPLMRYSRYRRERDALRERSGEAGPPKGASLLVAGLIALALAALVLVALLHGQVDVDRQAVQGMGIFAVAGVGAIVLGFRRIRARRAWHAERRGR